MKTESRTVQAFAELVTLLRDYTRPIESATHTAQRSRTIAARLEFDLEADDAFAQKIRAQTKRRRAAIGSNVGWREFAEAIMQVERELIQLRENHGDRNNN
jgi:hypothetical protein